MNLESLEKLINSELTTKINSSSINHDELKLKIDEEDLHSVILFLKNVGLAGGFLFIVVNGTKDWSLDKEKKFVRL